MRLEEGISIIVPVYNVKKYLRRAVDSYLDQSFRTKEILLIDDGSTDGSGSICDEYHFFYDTVRVIHLENSGVSNARNIGIQYARYKYVMFLDADDYLDKDVLDKIYNTVIGDGSDHVIYGYYTESRLGGKTVRLSHCLKEERLLTEFEEFHSLELWDMSLLYNVWNRLYDLEIIRENHIYFRPMKMGEDLEFNLHYMEYCQMISVMNQSFYHYVRDRADAATNHYIPDWFQIRCEEHARLWEYFERHHLMSEAREEFLSRRFSERVLGCLENRFHSEGKQTLKDMREYIGELLNHEEVKKSLRRMRPKSIKTALMIYPMSKNNIPLTYVMSKGTAFMKKKYPRLFLRLKHAR